MTEPLTPKEARLIAHQIESNLPHWKDQIAATLRAYANQSERLKEIETATERFVQVAEQCAKIVDRNLYHQREKVQDVTGLLLTEVARLRSLMEEKNHD